MAPNEVSSAMHRRTTASSVGNASTNNEKNAISFSPTEIERIDSYQSSHKISILTIMFSDIVGYTQLCEKAPEAVLSKVRASFDNITSQVIEKNNGGLIVKRIGDAVLAIYARPTSAVLAALELHESLSKKLVEGLPLQLRSGIHLGQVAITEAGTHIDIFGRHVNRTARIQAVARPGEILVTEVIEDNVQGWLDTTRDKEIVFRRRKAHFLKGLPAPVSVYALQRGRTVAVKAERRGPENYVELRVASGPEIGTVLRFDVDYGRQIIIGRSVDCDMLITDTFASRKHAMILVDGKGAHVWDLGAANGTYVNGKLINRCRVMAGDRIRVGDAVILIEALRLPRNRSFKPLRSAPPSKKSREKARKEDLFFGNKATSRR